MRRSLAHQLNAVQGFAPAFAIPSAPAWLYPVHMNSRSVKMKKPVSGTYRTSRTVARRAGARAGKEARDVRTSRLVITPPTEPASFSVDDMVDGERSSEEILAALRNN